MRKLVLLGLTEEREKILKKLQRTQLVEIKSTEESDATDSIDLSHEKDFFISQKAILTSCLAEIEEGIKLNRKLNADEIKKTPLKETIKNFASPIERIAYDEFLKIKDSADELLEDAKEVAKLYTEIAELEGKKTEILAEKENLRPYIDFELPFSSVSSTRYTESYLGLLGGNIDNLIAEIGDKSYIERIGADGKLIFVITHKDDSKEVFDTLSKYEFSPCPYKKDNTPKEIIEEYDKKLETLLEREKDLIRSVAAFSEKKTLFERLYDYYDLEEKRLESAEKCRATAKCFVLEAWYPFPEEEKIDNAIKGLDSVVAYDKVDPRDDEVVPSLIKNSFVIEKFQAVTNMYSVPDYREVDPNPTVAVFFFLFFGIMMGDAAYGIILTVLATTLLIIKKPKRGEMNLVFIIAFGGVSTIIWGILFGGWFGIDISGTVLDKIKWFSPLDEPIKMMVLSVAIGAVQIVVGMFMNFLNLIRRKQYVYAIGNVFGWYTIFIGIGFLALPILIENAPSYFKIIAIVCFVVGFIGLTVAGGVGKKGVAKLFGGLKELYSITGYLSDVLSYTRLFGLGLSSGVVAMVVNKIATVFFTLIPVLGYIIGIIILLIGHVFNIAINTLGAYVHNCRLQYIEYFQKFYTGEGHVFIPLGSKTKYTNLNYN